MPPNLHDCTFQVRNRYKYAARATSKLVKKVNAEVRKVKLDRLLSHLDSKASGASKEKWEEEQLPYEQLTGSTKPTKHGADQDVETALNAAEFLRTVGQPVLYGQVLQLYHVPSKAFVTVKREPADMEAACMKVVLQEEGDEGSWFLVSPAYRTKNDGDEVGLGDACNLSSLKYHNTSLRYSSQEVQKGAWGAHPCVISTREVNAGPGATCWQIVPFAKHQVAVRRALDVLKGGDTILIYHRASDSVLLYEDGEVLFQQRDQNHTSRNAFWRIETDTVEWAGCPLSWERAYRMKHLATMQYLECPDAEGSRVPVRLTTDYANKATLWTLHPSSTGAGLFVSLQSLLHLQGTEGWLSDGFGRDVLEPAVVIAPSGVVTRVQPIAIHRIVKHVEKGLKKAFDHTLGDIFTAEGSHRKQEGEPTESTEPLKVPKADAPARRSAVLAAGQNQKDALVFEAIAESAASEVTEEYHSTLSITWCTHCLRTTLPIHQFDSEETPSSAGSPARSESLETPLKVPKKPKWRFLSKKRPDKGPKPQIPLPPVVEDPLRAESFARGRNSLSFDAVEAADEENLGLLVAETGLREVLESEGPQLLDNLERMTSNICGAEPQGIPNTSFQELLKDLRTVEAILDLLYVLFHEKQLPLWTVHCPAVFGDFDMLRLAKSLSSFLQAACKNFAPTQELLAQHVDLLVALSAAEFQTGDVLTAVYTDNLELIQSIDQDEVKQAVHRMAATQRPRYVKFLEALCMCDGHPVPANQALVVALLSREPELLVTVQVQLLADEPSVILRGQNGATADCLHFQKQDNLDPNANTSSLPSDETLFLFYLALLDLFASLCCNRNRLAASWLLQESDNLGLSYKDLMGMVFQESLPYALRTRCATLLTRIYVDRDPYQMSVNPSKMTKTWAPHKLRRTEAQPSITFGQADLFQDFPQKGPEHGYSELRRHILQYFQTTASNPNPNPNDDRAALTLAICQLCYLLLSFGAFGKTDFAREGQESPQSATVCALLDAILPLLDDRTGGKPGTGGSRTGSKPGTGGGWTGGNFHLPGVDGLTGGSRQTSVKSQASEDQTGVHPWTGGTSRGHELVMQSKCELCRILLLILDMHGSWSVEEAYKFYAALGGTTVERLWKLEDLTVNAEATDALAKMGSELFQVSTLAGKANGQELPYVMEVLVALTRGQHVPVKALAFAVIDRLTTVREVTLGFMQDLLVVTEPDDINLYSQATTDCLELQLLQPSLTSDHPEKRHEARQRNLLVLQGWSDLCTPNEMPSSWSPAAVRRHQNLLHRLGAHLRAADVLRVSFKLIPAAKQGEMDQMDDSGLREVFASAYDFLMKFCGGVVNEVNQLAVFELGGLIRSHLSLGGLNAGGCLAAALTSNMELCSELDTSFFEHIVSLILKHGQRPQWLYLLEVSLMVMGKKALKRNQDIVLQLILEATDQVLSLAKCKRGWTRREVLLSETPDSIDLSPTALMLGMPAAQELRYHISSVSLLAACCWGNNPAAAVKVSGLICVSDLMATLLYVGEGVQYGHPSKLIMPPLSKAGPNVVRALKSAYFMLLHQSYVNGYYQRAIAALQTPGAGFWPLQRKVNQWEVIKAAVTASSRLQHLKQEKQPSPVVSRHAPSPAKHLAPNGSPSMRLLPKCTRSVLEDMILELREALAEGPDDAVGPLRQYVSRAMLPMVASFFKNHSQGRGRLQEEAKMLLDALADAAGSLYLAVTDFEVKDASRKVLKELLSTGLIRTSVLGSELEDTDPKRKNKRKQRKSLLLAEGTLTKGGMFRNNWAVFCQWLEAATAGETAGLDLDGCQNLAILLARTGPVPNLIPPCTYPEVVQALTGLLASRLRPKELPAELAVHLLRVLRCMLYLTPGGPAEAPEDLSGLQLLALFHEEAPLAKSKRSPSALVQAQAWFDKLGCTKAALYLASDANPGVRCEAVKLLIGLLDEGNEQVQATMFKELASQPEFFVTMKTTLNTGAHDAKFIAKALKKQRTGKEGIVAEADKAYWKEGLEHAKRGAVMMSAHIREVLRLLQLMCEGHNIHMQHLLRGQLWSSKDRDKAALSRSDGSLYYCNLIEEVIGLLEHLQPGLEASLQTGQLVLVDTALQALATILETIQGPCFENQLQVARSNCLSITERLVATLDFVPLQQGTGMREALTRCNDLCLTLRLAVLDTYTGLLEEINDNHEIPSKLISVVDFKSLLHRAQEALCLIDRGPLLEGFDLHRLKGLQAVLSKGALEAELCRNVINSLTLITKLDLYDQERRGGVDNTLKCQYGGGWCTGRQQVDKLCLKHAVAQVPRLQEYFEARSCCIEVHREGRLELVIFPLTDLCQHLAKQQVSAQEALNELREVPRDNPVQKVQCFLDSMRLLHQKLLYLESVQRRFLGAKWVQQNLTPIKRTPFYLAVLLISMVAVGYGEEWSTWLRHRLAVAVVQLLGWIQLLVCFFVFAVFFILEYPVLLLSFASKEAEAARSKKVEELQEGLHLDVFSLDSFRQKLAAKGRHSSLLVLVSCKDFWYYLGLILFSLAGVAFSPFFFLFHLLDFLFYHPAGFIVMQSAYVGGPLLLRTGLVGVLVILMYAVVSFFVFAGQEGHDGAKCVTMYECIGEHMVSALASSSLGDLFPSWDQIPRSILDNPMHQLRTFYILTFLIVWVFLLQNIFTGQIVDAFTSIRDEKAAAAVDLENRCFICSIERFPFDETPGGFLEHVNHEHNPLHYLFYADYLKKKNPIDFTGLESYVERLVRARKVDWIPVGRARRIDRQKQAQEHGHDVKELSHVMGLLERLEARIEKLEGVPATVRGQAEEG